jgi:ATP-binding cassette, subfamily B, bacterial
VISTILRFRSFMRQYRLRLAAGGLLTLANALLALAQPWPLKVIVDNVLKEHPIDLPGVGFVQGWSRQELLDAAIVAYIAIILLGAVADFFGTYLMDSSGERLVSDVREAMFARMQRLSLRFHSTQRTGDLMSRVMGDIGRVQDMLVQSFSILVPNVVLLVGMMVVMFLIDWSFTLIALSISPFLFLSVYSYTNRIKGASRAARKHEGQLAARANEVLGAVRVVQAFTRERYEDERFSEQSSHTLDANLQAVRLQAQFSPLIDILAGTGTAAVLWVGTNRVLSGQLSLGTLLVFLSYVNSLYKPMRQLSKLSYISSRGVASAERVAEILEAERDVRDLPGAHKVKKLRGRVEFDAVELAYGEQAVLHDIHLEAEPGQTIAIVGPTGAGKSSLVGLIPRFFDPRKGRVIVDGMDVRSLKLRSLRSQVAIVLQEPILFEGTIYDNIAYGSRRKASQANVMAAGKAALVEDFVQHLPDGYDTVIGERGGTLSGGERQRVSIARALVRDAPILILDEPTSSLDPASEQLLMQALRNLMAGRTAFVIAHRMTTIASADEVIVLDRGRIVERGTHARLNGLSDGLYRSFVDLQFGAVQAAASDTTEPRDARNEWRKRLENYVVSGQREQQQGDDRHARPARAASAGAERHLQLVSTMEGYVLVERDGPPPPLGAGVDPPELTGSFVVTKLGPSPLPRDLRVCAYLEPVAGTNHSGTSAR